MILKYTAHPGRSNCMLKTDNFSKNMTKPDVSGITPYYDVQYGVISDS